MLHGSCMQSVRTFTGEGRDGSEAEIQLAQVGWPQVRPQGIEERRERDAASQEGHAQEWSRREGRQGEEPRAGDRGRPERGTRQGPEGAEEEVEPEARLVEEVVGSEVGVQEVVLAEVVLAQEHWPTAQVVAIMQA